ncbi:MAG: class I SAM-dependent methyltransferase [Sphingomonadaceae bacterium]|nr:class I SAM-dependent methyltransferase [Sphingomonadaceae bacterium]
MRSLARGQLPFKHWRTAPVDRLYGIETSSYVRIGKLATGDAKIDTNNVGYVGSQPSIVRAALDHIPDLGEKTFVDLGCGKGRTLAVASEYPFRRIVGIEIAPVLLRIARSNAGIIRANFPGRASIEVIEADATDIASYGAENLVLFLYNSFRGALIDRLIASIDQWLAKNRSQSLFLIYYNPVHFARFDRAPALERFYAECVSFHPDERLVQPFDNDFDSLVIYRAKGRDTSPQRAGHDRRVSVTIPDLGAAVEN